MVMERGDSVWRVFEADAMEFYRAGGDEHIASVAERHAALTSGSAAVERRS